jgi:hypothetical protein
MWRRSWRVAIGDIPRPPLPEKDGPDEGFCQAYREYCDDSHTAEYIMGLGSVIGAGIGTALAPQCDWITLFVWGASGAIHGTVAGLVPLVGVPCIAYAFAFTVVTWGNP